MKLIPGKLYSVISCLAALEFGRGDTLREVVDYNAGDILLFVETHNDRYGSRFLDAKGRVVGLCSLATRDPESFITGPVARKEQTK